MATYTLPRIERLHYKKDIDELFATGKGFVAYPLRVVYTTLPLEEGEASVPAEMLVSVSKRYFKRANKRNRVKRLVREAYRLNKHNLWHSVEEAGCRLRLAFMFVGKELPEYTDIEHAVLKAFKRIHKTINPINDSL